MQKEGGVRCGLEHKYDSESLIFHLFTLLLCLVYIFFCPLRYEKATDSVWRQSVIDRQPMTSSFGVGGELHWQERSWLEAGSWLWLGCIIAREGREGQAWPGRAGSGALQRMNGAQFAESVGSSGIEALNHKRKKRKRRERRHQTWMGKCSWGSESWRIKRPENQKSGLGGTAPCYFRCAANTELPDCL